MHGVASSLGHSLYICVSERKGYRGVLIKTFLTGVSKIQTLAHSLCMYT